MIAPTTRRKAAFVLSAALLPLFALHAPAGAVVEPSALALDWIEGELADDGGHLTTAYEFEGDTYTYDDWGLTIDAILALAAGGRGSETAATTALGLVETNVADYVTGGAFGPDDRYAAALAKTLLVASIQGSDAADFGGFDLVDELLDRLQTSGDDAGRFSDLTGFGDFSNGLGQALAVMALDRATGDVPDTALDFLLAQQCPGGGFRGDYSTTGGCAEEGDATVDATGFAVQALLAVTPDCSVRSAVANAVAWLESTQGGDGGFGAESGANTNSTGLAAQVLRALGHTERADDGAAFIADLQLADGDDMGAIALNDAGFASAGDGIQVLERDGFRRATGQAVLGLGLPPYSTIGLPAVDPADYTQCLPQEPTPPTPTVSASAGSAAAGDSITLTAGGFQAGETVTATIYSTPVVLGSAVADAQGGVALTVTLPDLEPGVHRIELVGASSGRVASTTIEVVAESSPTTLPATGAAAMGLALVGLGLVAAGSGSMAASRRLVRGR